MSRLYFDHGPADEDEAAEMWQEPARVWSSVDDRRVTNPQPARTEKPSWMSAEAWGWQQKEGAS